MAEQREEAPSLKSENNAASSQVTYVSRIVFAKHTETLLRDSHFWRDSHLLPVVERQHLCAVFFFSILALFNSLNSQPAD